MPSTLTVTFIPCIDKYIDVAELIPDKKLVCSSPILSPGGGGINVARVLKRFGKEVVAFYPSGGYTGKYLNEMMHEQHVEVFTVNTTEATRENIIVNETHSRRQFRLGTPSVALAPAEYEKLMTELERNISFRYLVISGSFPPGVEKDAITRLSILARNRNARLIVDTKGEPLKQALASGVFLLKPNIGELAGLAGRSYLPESDVESTARGLLNSHPCEAMLVSMGEAGAMLITKTSTSKIAAPSVIRVSTVGAGDSMVAGIVAGLTDNYSLDEAVRFGVACGTATTLRKGTALCELEDALRLYNQMH